MRRSTNNPFEEGECVTAEYSYKDNGRRVKVDNNQFYGFYSGSDSNEGGVGEAWVNRFTSGLLFVTFFFDFGGGYRILDTDYTSYTIIYSCENVLANAWLLSEYTWVLTRDNIVDGSTEYDNMRAVVDPIFDEKIPHYDYDDLMRTTQQGAGCTYYTN